MFLALFILCLLIFGYLPLLQAHPTWAQDNTEAAGSPFAVSPPFVLRLAPTHLGWDTRWQFTRRSRDPPRSKRRQYYSCFPHCVILIRDRRHLFTYYTRKTLLNYVFEDLRKTKAPNRNKNSKFRYLKLYLSIENWGYNLENQELF